MSGSAAHRLLNEKEAAMPNEQLKRIEHIVVLMLENRSFDSMLGFLYPDSHNISPAGHPFEGLTGSESNPDEQGARVTVFKLKIGETVPPYFAPGADPGEATRLPTCSCSALTWRRRRRPPPTTASSPTSPPH